MQTLTIPLSDIEKMKVGDEITRLFALQDMPMGKEKKAIFVEEMSSSGLPCEALISGIRSLVTEDLKTIKLNTLLGAAKKFIEQPEVQNTCEKCMDGIIVMRDDQKRAFSLGCVCERGAQRSEALGVSRWNGENSMFTRNRLLEFLERA